MSHNHSMALKHLVQELFRRPEDNKNRIESTAFEDFDITTH